MGNLLHGSQQVSTHDFQWSRLVKTDFHSLLPPCSKLEKFTLKRCWRRYLCQHSSLPCRDVGTELWVCQEHKACHTTPRASRGVEGGIWNAEVDIQSCILCEPKGSNAISFNAVALSGCFMFEVRCLPCPGVEGGSQVATVTDHGYESAPAADLAWGLKRRTCHGLLGLSSTS